MAGTLLHVTLADRLLERTRDPARLAEARANIDDYHLGAVLVDLPYFDRLWLSGIKAALGKPLSFDPWGTAIHGRAPATLARELLDRSATAAERALSLGALTHMAVDLAFHPHISREVDAQARGPTMRDSTHKRIEDALDHHCHLHLLGHRGIGTPYAARALAILPSLGWTGMVREAIIAVHGAAPAAGRFGRWLMNLRAFGFASVTPAAPWVPRPPAEDPVARERAISLAEEALSLCDRFVDAGLSYLEGALDAPGFLAVVPDVSLLDGGPAGPGMRPRAVRQPA